MNAYRGPDTGLDARDTAVSETVMSPVLREHIVTGGRDGEVRRQAGRSPDGQDLSWGSRRASLSRGLQVETWQIRRSREMSPTHLSP